MQQLSIDFKAALCGLVGSMILYRVCTIIYRIFFSDLAKFPGPKLAAATSWYEAYFDIRYANFPDVLQKWHDKYGPIIRINPWELSIRDAEFFNELYVPAGKRRTESISQSRIGIGLSDTIPATINHELHQLRRKQVENFFSRKSIIRMEVSIQDEVRSFDDRLRLLTGTNTLVRLDHAFACIAGDLAALFACGKNPQLLDAPDFNPEWHGSLVDVATIVPYVRNLPWITRYPNYTNLNNVLKLIPTGLVRKLNSRFAGFRMFQDICNRRIEEVKSDISSKPEIEESDKTSIFHCILLSDLPESEKDSARLQREAFALLGAGTMTTASALALITYYILADPSIENRLREDLKYITGDFPQKFPQWADLEKISYLMGCVKEGLRLSRFFRRSQRISPDYDLQYNNWNIPKNTPVGMSVCHLHMDPEVYPEPYKFIPERWIGDADPSVHRNFVPFVKGSRSCLGMNLAWAELYIVLGLLFRDGGHQMRLECDESDIVPIYDGDVGLPKSNSRGLRVRIQ
ncbi:putative cytochrome P450 [Nemania abortiva]|nr:putative cytochrome P450 [Nemania abortiva]